MNSPSISNPGLGLTKIKKTMPSRGHSSTHVCYIHIAIASLALSKTAGILTKNKYPVIYI